MSFKTKLPFITIFRAHQQNQYQSLSNLLRLSISDAGDYLPLVVRSIHAQSLIAGLGYDLFFNNLLLNAYSKIDRIGDAQLVFDEMRQPNIISWSSMISMYAQKHCEDESLSLFSRFWRNSFESPNEFILASVLRACLRAGGQGFARQIHGLVVKNGFLLDVYVGTALINYYAKNGVLEDVVSIFDELPMRNSATWTVVITMYSQIGMNWNAMNLFNQMREFGVAPDRFVISSVISACAVEGFLEGGRQLHGYAYRSSIEMDVSLNNVLIDLYCKCSKVEVARRLFNSMDVINLVSWTTMIAGYMQNSFHHEVLDLFSVMTQLGWQPNSFACTSALSSCGSLIALKQGKQVHAYAIRAYLESDEFVKNALLDMYTECNSLVDARGLFDMLPDHCVISYNTMIKGYAKHENLVGAFTLFNTMRFRSIPPSILTFVSLLGLSASLLAVDLSKQVHGLMVKIGVSLDIFAASALIDVYSKCSFVDDASIIFHSIDDRDLVVWNAMIHGYTLNGQGEEALQLFHRLLACGIPPNEFTYVALVTAISTFASLFHGLQFHIAVIKAGVEGDPTVSNALIDMYAKCGCLNEAWLLFKYASERDIACWNSMISTFAQHGHAEKALKVFQLMRNEEIEPNYVTFVSVLSACSHSGLVKEGLSHFNAMREEYGIEPGMEHYASIVNLLGRAGKVNEAKHFIDKMPVEPAASIWRSLLSACKVHGDVELGKHAAKMVISVEPRDSGSYVLLSNILASKQMWTDVEKIRMGMVHTGTVKETGYSWIEVMKEVHVFIARGREHKETELIYSVLDELTKLIKEVADVPEMIFDLVTNVHD